MRALLCRCRNFVRGRFERLHMADRDDGRAIAGAHAGSAQYADVLAEFLRKFVEQFFRAAHGAGKRVADPDGDCGRRRVALLHHVEVRVERRDLIDLGERQFHFGRERNEMWR